MCRLLGWVGRRPLSLGDALSGAELAAFSALSRQHADGWGMAGWAEGPGSPGTPWVRRSTTCAADDPLFTELVGGVASDAGFVHLRWATPGLPVVLANTHPFRRGRLAMAHNGAIHPQSRLDQILPAGWSSQMSGTTDSERYFLAIAARIEDGDSTADAVTAVVDQIFEDLQPTSLNAMLLGPDALYVVSAYDQQQAPSRAASAGGAPALDRDTVFYDLRYRSRADSVVVASSGFAQPERDGWQPVENMSLLRIERGTLTTSVSSLEPAARSRV